MERIWGAERQNGVFKTGTSWYFLSVRADRSADH